MYKYNKQFLIILIMKKKLIGQDLLPLTGILGKILKYLYKDATVYLDRKKEKMLNFKALNDYQATT